MELTKKYKGTTVKFLLMLLKHFFVAAVIYFCIWGFIDDYFYYSSFTSIALLAVLVGCAAYFLFYGWRTLKNFLLTFQLEKDFFTVNNQEKWVYQDVTVQSEVNRYSWNGIPLRNKFNLCIVDKQGALLKKYDLNGLPWAKANDLINDLMRATEQMEYKEKNQQGFSRRSFEEQTFATMLSRKWAFGITTVFFAFFFVIITAGVYYMYSLGEMSEVPGSIYLPPALIAVYLLIVISQKKVNNFPERIRITEEAIYFDDRRIPINEIESISYTPADANMIRRNVTIKLTNNKKMIQLLGTNGKPHKNPRKNKVFIEYPLFIEGLKERFREQPEILSADAALSKSY